MKGAVLLKGENCYVKLGEFFFKMNNFQKEYNWFITDAECYPENKKYRQLLSNKYCFLTGEQLSQMIKKEDFQWIWGVFSGFDKNIKLDKILNYNLPYADGNENLWKTFNTQHPLANIEIVAWDSSLMLIKSNDANIINRFFDKFELAEDLSKYIN